MVICLTNLSEYYLLYYSILYLIDWLTGFTLTYNKPAYTVGTISTSLLLTQGMPVRGNPLTPNPSQKAVRGKKTARARLEWQGRNG